jgi:hypothetical protein
MLQLCVPNRQVTASPAAGLSPLMRWLHSSRADLRSTFDLNEARGVREYSSWFWASGVVEHGFVSLLRCASQMSLRYPAVTT